MGHEIGSARRSRGGAGGGAATVESVEDVDERRGLYLARSRGSLHVFDLDAGGYLRLPGERSNAFPHDVSVLRLTSVERWPHVGDSFFIWVDSPAEYAVWDYWRQSSPIEALYRVRSADQHPGRGWLDDGRGGGRTVAAGSAAAAAFAPDSPDSPAAPETSIDMRVTRMSGAPLTPTRDARAAAAHPMPGQAEILPGLEVAVDGVWQIVTSSEGPLDVRGSRLRPRPILEWTLASDEEWLTLLVLYQLEERELLEAHLEVRRADGTSPMRSTSPLTLMRLVIPVQPELPTRRPDP